MKSRIIILLAFVSTLFAACQPVANTNQNANSAASKNAWDTYVEQFLSDYFVANPTFAVLQGKHEFDGKFPDWSEAGLQKEIARLKSERERAAGRLGDRSALEVDGQIGAREGGLHELLDLRLREGDRWSVTVTAASRHRRTKGGDAGRRHITGFEYADQNPDTQQTIRVLFERLAAEETVE